MQNDSRRNGRKGSHKYILRNAGGPSPDTPNPPSDATRKQRIRRRIREIKIRVNEQLAGSAPADIQTLGEPCYIDSTQGKCVVTTTRSSKHQPDEWTKVGQVRPLSASQHVLSPAERWLQEGGMENDEDIPLCCFADLESVDPEIWSKSKKAFDQGQRGILR